MAKDRIGYIDLHGLGPRILEMLLDGQKPTEIARILKAEGHKMSQPTISRWIKKKNATNDLAADKIMEEHVARELPKDLDALEEFQALARDWALEDPDASAEKIANQERVQGAMPEWRELILGAPNDKDQSRAMRAILDQVLRWVFEHYDARLKRIKYMKASMLAIGYKLQHASVIDSTERGQIIIRYNKQDPTTGTPDDDGKSDRKHKLFSFPGGKRE